MRNGNDAAETRSEAVAAFVAGFDIARAPDGLIARAETAFLDTIGVMLAGSREPAARIVCDCIAADAAAPVATVVGRRLRTSPANAALANGTATQALDFDLSFMIGQSAAALIPGLLPLAESLDAAPRELIAAWVAGCEVCSRLARTFPTLSSEGGWHGTGVLGAVAAAAAFARLSRVPAARVPDIIGIAASAASGIGANFGTMTKPLHAGLAARSGLTAVSLGAGGLTASREALEGRQGFFAAFAQTREWDPAPFDDLGQRFDLLDPGYKIKPYACGGLMHTSIAAALGLRERLDGHRKGIARIRIGVSPHAKGRALDVYPWSEDSARFSLPYLVGYALLRGAPLPPAFQDDAIADDRVRALAERVDVAVDEEFAALTGSGYSPARVTIELESGDRLEETVYHPPGAPEAPLGEDEIDEKFFACAGAAVSEAAARKLRETLCGLHARKDLSGLWPLLAGED